VPEQHQQAFYNALTSPGRNGSLPANFRATLADTPEIIPSP
jgi:hypothetical protein